MKRIVLLLSSAALLLVSCNNSGDEATKTDTPAAETKTETTEAKKDVPPGPPDSAQMAAMTKAWIDFATPGDMHKWMAKSAGNWVCDSVAQWMYPAAPPAYSKATSTEKVLMGGLYMEGNYSGNMMGAPMTGHTISGYDKMKKKFVSSWIDNMGSGIVRFEGDYDAATKTLNMKGKQSDPSKNMETDMRQEQKWIDDNTYVLTMYGTGHDGKTEQKFMQGTFKRKK
jgi:hypothetical protein